MAKDDAFAGTPRPSAQGRRPAGRIRDLLAAAVLTAGVALGASSASAMDGTLNYTTMPSVDVPSPEDIAIYTPPGYDPHRAEPYPLLIQLHGGGGSDKHMALMAGLLEKAIKAGLLPPVVSVMPSAGRSFYMDFKDGSQKWETYITTELLAYMRKNYNVAQGRKGTFITGISMGGMGSLRIAFKHPDLFQAVASQEPGIEPAFAFDDIKLRDRFWRSDALFKQIYGDPIDKAYWAANNPATIARDHPDRLLSLGIYIEAGDQDMFYLEQGTEFLHRVLFDAGISHQYRLVKGGDHVGPSVVPRFLDAMGFIGQQINPPDWINGEVLKVRAWLDTQKRAAGYPVVPFDPERIHSH